MVHRPLIVVTKIALATAVIIISCCSSNGQLTLNAGDQWSFQSGVLNGGLTATFAENGGRQYARIKFKTLSSALTESESLRIEVFEDAASGNQIASKTFNGPFDEGQMDVIGAWPDRQGAVRLTMLSGSITITNLTLISAFPGPSGLALIFQTNIFNFTPPLPGPRLTLVNDVVFAPFYFQLLWPTNSSSYRLEEADTLSHPVWRPITNFVGLSGTNYTYVFETYEPVGRPLQPASARYFRLRKPF